MLLCSDPPPVQPMLEEMHDGQNLRNDSRQNRGDVRPELRRAIYGFEYGCFPALADYEGRTIIGAEAGLEASFRPSRPIECYGFRILHSGFCIDIDPVLRGCNIRNTRATSIENGPKAWEKHQGFYMSFNASFSVICTGRQARAASG